MIYLDNNATTPVDPEVYDAIFSSLKRDVGNPSSIHLSGRKARETVESARQDVADLLNCSPEEIYFTSGGTESNNLSLIGALGGRGKGHIITSAIEHPSVINTCVYLESIGFEVTYLNADSEGVVRLEDISKAIRETTIMISVMHANNETGVLQPVEEICETARERGIPFHVDAAQTIGKMHLSASPPADLMTIAPHKFYGPKGIGALYVRKGILLKPIFFGASHEKGLRPGTENVPGIAGLGKACQIAKRDVNRRVSHTARLRDMLLDGIMKSVPFTTLNGHHTNRLPNTLNLRIRGVRSVELVEKLGDSVAISSGSACHEGRMKPSYVLKSMGLSDEDALSSFRLSIGKDNTGEEMEEAVERISEAVRILRENPGPD
jgi:cysteine desulfurase